MEMSKPWYRSRTVVTNLLAAVALLVQSQTGYVVPVEVQGAVLTLLNVVLRFDTREPVSRR